MIPPQPSTETPPPDGRRTWSALEQLAAERRLVARTVAVRCPDADHLVAAAGMPCEDPSTAHPWGRVCFARIAMEIDTRDQRAQQQRQKGARDAKAAVKRQRIRRRVRAMRDVHLAAIEPRDA